MTLSEFIKDLYNEMYDNNWEDREIEFATIDRTKLLYLSIYDLDGDDGKSNICIDIGESGE